MNANLILPRLWLGNRLAAQDPDFLQRNNITVVFNCTKDLPFHPSVLRKYRLPVDDNLAAEEIANMEKWGPEATYKVLSEYNSGQNILIHCFAGMQRSAALMAMTLIVLTKQPSDSVINFIRSKRPIAFFPGQNFGKAIRGFESTFKGAPPPSKPPPINLISDNF
jgi:protein tyrosine phosphatase